MTSWVESTLPLRLLQGGEHLRLLATGVLARGGGAVLHVTGPVSASAPRTMALTDDPLPDEPFDWSGVAEDVQGRLREVVDLVDECCAEILDVEHRTAARRLLARAVVADPKIFRRRGAPERAAAAICWVICRATTPSPLTGGLSRLKELLAWFGVRGSVSQHAHVFLAAIGVDPHRRYGAMDLGSVDYLVGERRRDLIAIRDRWLAH